MTRKTLEKIEGTIYKTTLENKKEARTRLAKLGHEKEAKSVQASVAGYVQAMRDFGIITERERQELFIYYGTI